MKRRAILLMAAIGATLIVASGVALAESVRCDAAPPCYGTPELDEIWGTASGETIYALGGPDGAYAGGGADTVYGAEGNDINLLGEEGNDTVYGGSGKDKIDAISDDTLGSVDHSYGGGGNDWIAAVDGNLDIVNCGKGTDEVIYDADLDTVKGCENKNPQ